MDTAVEDHIQDQATVTDRVDTTNEGMTHTEETHMTTLDEEVTNIEVATTDIHTIDIEKGMTHSYDSFI